MIQRELPPGDYNRKRGRRVMKDSVKKLLICGAAIVIIVVVCVVLNLRTVPDFHDKYAGTSVKADGVEYLILAAADILAVIE